MPGPFSEPDFNIALADFIDKADAFCKPTWTIHKDARGRYYARQSTMMHRGEGRHSVSLNRQVYIAYNPSYGVPVLWFNFYHRDGQCLTADEVLELVATPHRMALGRDLSTAIAANEQPQLGVLFYHFHPCHTAQLLAELRNSQNLFLSWLSIYAPVIGIQLPVEILREAVFDSASGDAGPSTPSSRVEAEEERDERSGVTIRVHPPDSEEPAVDMEEAAASSEKESSSSNESSDKQTEETSEESVEEVTKTLAETVIEEKEDESIPDDPASELAELELKTDNGHLTRAAEQPVQPVS